MHTHKILKIARPDTGLQNTFHKELGISKILAQVLINRGITGVKEAARFLDVSLQNLADPFTFTGMSEAVYLLKKAAREKQKVLLLGDYDVDGLTAIALLKSTFARMGIEAAHFLPHRTRDGYGIPRHIIQTAIAKKIDLVVTADCGISNIEQIKELRRAGVDVIVTDHHEPKLAELPPATSIINPKVKNSGYGYRELAGVGVAYKLAQALCEDGLFGELDLVCLGTIADVVPLTGENRIIAKEGLERLSKTARPGLRALMDNSGIRGKKMNSTFVNFILGPRLNASGRMDTAEISLELLLSENKEKAEELAAAVERYNRQRQKVEGRIMEEAQEMINKQVNFKEHKVIVIAKEDWHHGVLGIVASKIADRFYRPAIVISLSDDLCKGSGRSIKNFHLFDALCGCAGLLDSFGGHSHAAGLVIARGNINEFRQSINRLAVESLKVEDLLPCIEADMELPFSDLNQDFIEELLSLEPFGTANPEPLFFTKGLRLKGQAQVLARDTLKFWVTDGNATQQAIAFRMAGFKEDLSKAKSFDLVYTPRMDNWQGESKAILEVSDIFFK